MNDIPETARVLCDMRKYRLDILGISEFQLTASGRQLMSGGMILLYKGHENKHIHSVAIAM